jgi:RNA polymerase sigma-70 factor (ECF subfamily)
MKTDIVHGVEQYFTQKRDDILVKEAREGKAASFAKLMSLYKRRVEAVGMGFFRNRADTEDFVQDVFLKAYTNLASFRGESLFSTWLTRIAYTTAINTKNRRKEYEPISDETLLPSPGETPEDSEIRRITIEAVHEAVKELPERYAQCLDLYFFYDTAYDEIAVITGLPVNTIKSHIFRAKKILRTKLKDYT